MPISSEDLSCAGPESPSQLQLPAQACFGLWMGLGPGLCCSRSGQRCCRRMQGRSHHQCARGSYQASIHSCRSASKLASSCVAVQRDGFEEALAFLYGSQQHGLQQ